MRFVRFSSAARRLWVAAVVLLFSSAARADIDAWYEVTASTGPVGTGVVSVQQGTAGQQLIITTDSASGTYQFTIKLLCDVDAVDALYAYSVDLLAPTAANVEVTSLDLLGLFDAELPFAIGSGPGILIDDVSQYTFFSTQSGPLELFEFTLTLDGPPTDDVELFSGIGAFNWGSVNPPAIIRFGDADPLDGEVTDLVTNRPTIIIRQAPPPPPVGPPPPPPVDPPPLITPPTDPPPTEPPPVNPVPQDVTPSVESQSATQEQHNDIPPIKVVNRADLRKSLAMFFNVPADGIEPMTTLPARVFGFLGINLSIMWGLSDLAALPWRMMAFEVTYAILDRLLP